MNIIRLQTPIHCYTFQVKKIRDYVESKCHGHVLNLFAGMTKLNVDEVRVDKNPDMKPDFCMDAFNYLETTSDKFDTVILDPPYSLRKSMEYYRGNRVSSYRKILDSLHKVLNSGATIIQFGYSSVGMSKSRECEIEEIVLLCHSGAYHDTIIVVDKWIK